MVDKVMNKGKTIYRCELCGFGYSAIEIAERCEQYCHIHGSCSPEIMEKAIYKPQHKVMT